MNETGTIMPYCFERKKKNKNIEARPWICGDSITEQTNGQIDRQSDQKTDGLGWTIVMIIF